jgi:hypothetical protein
VESIGNTGFDGHPTPFDPDADLGLSERMLDDALIVSWFGSSKDLAADLVPPVAAILARALSPGRLQAIHIPVLCTSCDIENRHLASPRVQGHHLLQIISQVASFAQPFSGVPGSGCSLRSTGRAFPWAFSLVGFRRPNLRLPGDQMAVAPQHPDRLAAPRAVKRLEDGREESLACRTTAFDRVGSHR